MKKTIAVDIDEVLADFVPPLLLWHNRVYNTAHTKEQVHAYRMEQIWKCSEEEATRKIYEFYETPHFPELKPVTNSQECAKTLAAQYKLVTITSRPLHIYEQTINWLSQHFDGVFSGNYFTKNYSQYETMKRKAGICKDLEIKTIIEDSFVQAKNCAQKGIRALLLDCPWNREKTSAGVERVFSWNEIVEKLV